MPPFPYKTPPFGEYQRRILGDTMLKPFHFHAMEQGTGKTWVNINTAAALYLHGKITAMIVLAPNGVHAAWALDQVPQHMPDPVPWTAYVWDSSEELKLRQRANNGRLVSAAFKLFADDATRFPIFCVNTEAFGAVRAAQATVLYLLKARPCLLVVDESGDFTTPSAKRTRALLRLRTLAPYRRCLDGTPVGGSPFDLYAPYRFLHPAIIGQDTFASMKATYADWVELERGDNGRKFKIVATVNGQKQWRNLDVLAARIAPYTTRITKREALPFLPEKLFSKRYCTLTTEQRRLTRELTEALRTTLADGRTVTATNILTNYLRRQQIACGYVPTDAAWDYPLGEPPQPLAILPGDNPRVELCVEELARRRPADNPTIIWTRFHFDIDLLAPRLRAEGYRVGVYDGRTPAAERAAVVTDFQAGALDIFLGNPAAGGRGLNLYRATHVLYYANYFGLRRRLQSEDRAHRIGTVHPVHYTDLIARGSIDQLIVRALRANKELADLLTQDPTMTGWL